MRRLMLLAILIGGLVGAAGVNAETPRVLQGAVERVSDGDTLVALADNATKLRIRLLGIDAPEIPHGSKPGQPLGDEARLHLERLVSQRAVRIESFGPDIYKRLLAVIWVGATNVNIEMVRAGLAEIYKGARCQAYCRELKDAETKAQRERAGMWALERYESPAAYRKRTRT
jgi:endonuclease YncB( thermonuclease family)